MSRIVQISKSIHNHIFDEHTLCVTFVQECHNFSKNQSKLINQLITFFQWYVASTTIIEMALQVFKCNTFTQGFIFETEWTITLQDTLVGISEQLCGAWIQAASHTIFPRHNIYMLQVICCGGILYSPLRKISEYHQRHGL